jgi:hypothetical protein
MNYLDIEQSPRSHAGTNAELGRVKSDQALIDPGETDFAWLP